MTIEIDESIRAIWFIQLNPYVDWLAAVQEPAPGKGQLTYRFRYYEDNEAWGSEDRKSWYVFTGEYSKLLLTIKEMAEGLAKSSGGKMCELIRGARSLEEFNELFCSQSFAHVKKEPRSAPPT